MNENKFFNWKAQQLVIGLTIGFVLLLVMWLVVIIVPTGGGVSAAARTFAGRPLSVNSPQYSAVSRAWPEVAYQSEGSNAPVFLPLIFASNDGPVLFGPIHSGEGTYYAATGDGNCGFGPSPNNLMVAAMNYTDYANSAICGAYIQATGPNGSVVVRIVDSCPPCAPGDVDFSPQAFELIADLSAGRVPITWQLVSQPLDDPIVYHFKDGSNQWWTAVQIRNHRNPVAQFEYLGGDGEFHPVERVSYNYFVQASGMGPGPYTFRVTDVLGHVLVDSNIPHIENGDVPGAGQFPPP